MGFYNEFRFSPLVPQLSTLNQPPRTDLISARYGDGILPMGIIEAAGVYSFKAKTGSDLVITGYDMGSIAIPGWKYKSAATVDVFGETSVPVVSMFQNYNYGNQFFCKHKSRVLHANGYELFDACVMEIVAYSEPLTGDDLVKANEYFGVPIEVTTGVKWVDPVNGLDTNAGTKLLPWKNVEKARLSATAGDVIYIKSGINVVLSQNFHTSCTYKAIGKFELQSASGTVTMSNSALNVTLEGLIVNGMDGTTTVARFLANTTVKRCLIKNELTTLLLDNSGAISNTYTDCIFISRLGNGGISANVALSTFTGCLFSNVKTSTTVAQSFTNCNFLQVKAIESVATKLCTILGCNFNYAHKGVTTSTGATVNISYSNFTSTVDGVNAIEVGATATVFVCKNNSFISTHTTPTRATPMFIKATDLLSWDIENNYFFSETANPFYHLYLVNATSQVGRTGKVNYNYCINKSLSGFCLTVNGETAASDVNDGTEFIGNKIVGNLSFNSSDSSLHFILSNGGKNVTIKYNDIGYGGIGIVVKNGSLGTAFTANGVSYNKLTDMNNSIGIGGFAGVGVAGINIFNNTIEVSENAHINSSTRRMGIYAIQNAKNVIAKNNIINFKNGDGDLIYFDNYATSNGSIAEYNHLFGGEYLLSDETNHYSDLAAAQTAGKLLNCVVSDPLLNASLVPLVALSGADLGVGYNTGLDASSVWETETVGANIVTKAQPATWQKGAFIQ